MKKSKSIILALALTLVFTAAVGSTSAYMLRAAEPVSTVFEPSSISCEITGEDGFYVTNTGGTEAYIRAALIVTWKNSEGEIYGKRQPDSGDYTMTINEDVWLLADDGFYYYYAPVAAGETTEALACSIRSDPSNAPEGYTLSVEATASAVQSQPFDAVKSRWGADALGILEK